MKKAVLVVGQSHVGAIRLAARARAESHPDRPRVRAIHTLEKRYAPFYAGEGDAATFAPPLLAAIEEQIAWHQPLVVSVNGGNVHNMLTLVRHPRAFDFLLSEEDGLPLDPDAEPISEALVRAALDHGLVGDRFLLRLTKAAANAAFHLESPPPLFDNRTIEDHAAAHFEGMPAFGVSSPALRYKIWRLHSRIVAGYCAELGITFLPVPRETQDANGFLLPHLAGDATHGNQAYGDIVVRMLETL